jgi:hypothetical protein
MRIKNVLVVASTVVLVGTGLTSCSNKATEEQMKTLRELDSQRDNLRSDLSRANANLADVKGKLAAQDRELKDCNDDTQAANEWIRNWPNVWADSADWRVAPPPEPAPVTGTKATVRKKK